MYLGLNDYDKMPISILTIVCTNVYSIRYVLRLLKKNKIFINLIYSKFNLW